MKKIDSSVITLNAKKMIEEKYDLKKSFENYSNRIYHLADNKGK